MSFFDDKREEIEGFDKLLVEELMKYKGISIQQLGKKLPTSIKSSAKHSKNLIVQNLISNIDTEFQAKLDLLKIDLRTITVNTHGNCKENLTLPTFEFEDLYNTEWETSELKQYLESRKFLFVIFTEDKKGETYLSHCISWRMPMSDINGPVKEVWLDTREKIEQGPILTYTILDGHSKGRVKNNFIKATDRKCIHVRPHSNKSSYQDNNDASKLPKKAQWENKPAEYSEYFMTKQSFWLNKSYIKYNILSYASVPENVYFETPQLLCTYVLNSNFGIVNSKIEYSDYYKCLIDNNKIQIKIGEQVTKSLYGSEIENLNVLIGKNGAGKSSVIKSLFSPERIVRSHISFINIYYLVGNIFWISTNSPNFTEGYYKRDDEGVLHFESSSESKLDIHNKIEIFQFPTPDEISKETSALKYESLNSKRMEYFLKFIPEYYVEYSDDKNDMKNNTLIIKIDPFTNHDYQVLEGIYKANHVSTIRKMYKEDRKKSFILRYLEKMILVLLNMYPNFIVEEYRAKYTYSKHMYEKFADKNNLEFDSSITIDERIKYLENFLDVCFIEDIGLKYRKTIGLLKTIILDKEIEIFRKSGFDHYQIELKISEKTGVLSTIADLIQMNSDVLCCELKNISDGQQKFIEVLSFVYGCIQETNISSSSPVILLDEPDIHLHPEWSRNFVKYLVDISKFSNNRIQIIISTHSPFIVSDIPKEHIHTFKGKAGIANANASFGLSIGNLLTDENGFFMKYSIGEFSRNFITDMISNKDFSKIEMIDDKLLVNALRGLRDDNR